MYTTPPFALFALEDIPLRTLNWLLQQAHDGSTVDSWWWYLATADYRAAPQKRPYGPKEEGTKRPVPRSFRSPFIGRGLEGIVHWMKNKPQSVDVDDRFFGVLDKEAQASGNIAIRRLNDPRFEEEIASCLLKPAREGTLFLGGLDSSLDWNELINHMKYTLNI